MKLLSLIVLMTFLVIPITAASNLKAFSTSMGFSEFDVVLEELKCSDSELAVELASIINSLKDEAEITAKRRIKLKSKIGYVELEKEDDYTFTIAIFSTSEVSSKLDLAFDSATLKLGI